MTAKETLEVWKQIPGFPLYQVSNLGNVESPKGLLKQCLNPSGYPQVGLYQNKKQVTRRVHCLVLEAFVGPRPNGYHGAHLDGSRTNSRLDNLQWCTPKENISHKKLHGTWQAGEKHGGHKLSEADVLKILELRKSGETYWAIAKRFNVSDSPIKRICNGEGWKNLNVRTRLTGEELLSETAMERKHQARVKHLQNNVQNAKAKGKRCYRAPKADPAQVRELREAGLTIKQIAERLGFSTQPVYTALKTLAASTK